MTAIEEFFADDVNKSFKHNSNIILDELEQIEGISSNPIDKVVRWLKRRAYDSKIPILDTAIDFMSLSVLETILRYFDRKVETYYEGRENIFKVKPVIFAANHETEAEHLYLARACCELRDLNYPFTFFRKLNLKGITNKREVPIFFAKYQLFNYPIISTLFSSTAFPVERELSEKAGNSMRVGSTFLKRGSNILIYPEGTRNIEKQQRAKSGVIRLAIENKVPIVPIGHTGLYDLTGGGFVPKKSGIWYCIFGEPIYYDEYYDKELKYEDLRRLTGELMGIIDNLKERGRRKIQEIKENMFKESLKKSINEIVVDKFEKLDKKPKNPFDSLYRKFVKYSSRIPVIGDYLDAMTHASIRFSAGFVLNPLTFDIKVKGKENLDQFKGAIIASNHESFFDIFLYGLKLVPKPIIDYWGYFIPGQYHDITTKAWFMMKKELAEIPLISSWTLSAGGFPVIRGARDIEALEIAKALVLKERRVIIFPQQTTYKEIDVDSDKNKSGVIRMAIDLKKPIVPMSIKGSYDAMQHGVLQVLFPPKGFKLHLNIGEPIYYDEYYDKVLTRDDYKNLLKDLMQKIKDLHEEDLDMVDPELLTDVESPVDKILKGIGKLIRLPAKRLQDNGYKLPFEKIVNQITDKLGITNINKSDKKKFAKVSTIDKYLNKIRDRGEKYGLTKTFDKLFYKFTKNVCELLVNNLYDFRIFGQDNIPTDNQTGVIFLGMSNGGLIDFLFGSCLIPEQIHYMIDKKTYETPVVSTILKSLGFFRKTESPDDFEPLLQIKELLKKEKAKVGVLIQTKNQEKIIRTIAGVIKLAIEGKPSVIVPIHIGGSDTPFPPVKINVEIGRPIPIKRMRRDARYEMAKEIYEQLKELKTKTYQDRYL
ncbi:MAG: lysophospholipid acyltransferase family protein [Candidatus Helarchaeota archaeon]